MAVRIQDRDRRVREHLYRTRILATEQIAKLEFNGSIDYARNRLYKLRGEMVKSKTNVGGVGTVWELEKRHFDPLAKRDNRHPDPKYPGELEDSEHTVAVNEVYVSLVPLLTERSIPGLYPEDWRWLCEPFCHRCYGRSRIKPDAEIEVFGTAFLLERQTKRAKEKPERLYDKVFNYHRYENSPERRSDPRRLILIWACDTERDARAVLKASRCHPTKEPEELGMEPYESRRMTVLAGGTDDVVATIYQAALNGGRVL